MSAHHNSDSIQHLYEGDQSKLYSGVLAHHANEEESKAQIKRIVKITLLLTVITIAEVLVGLWAHYNQLYGAGSKVGLAFYFLGLTVFKAAMIVRVFMHLGDEKKNFVYAVITPLALFIWFIIAFITDGHFWLKMNNTQAHTKAQTEQVETK